MVDGLFVDRSDFLFKVPLAPFIVGFGVSWLLMAAELALPNHQLRAKSRLHVAYNVVALEILVYVVLVILLSG